MQFSLWQRFLRWATTTSVLAVGGGIYALALARGIWPLVILILGGALATAVTLQGPLLITFLWLIGQTTLFVFPNVYLNAIPGATVERALFLTLSGLLFLRAVFKRGPPERWLPIEVAMAVFLGIVTLSFLRGHMTYMLADLRSDLALLLDGYIVPMLGFMLIRRLEWRERHIELLFYLWLVAGVFQGVIGGLKVFFGVTTFAPTYWGAIHPDRATGTFSNASEYGAVLSIMLLLALFLYTRAREILHRAALLTAMLVILGGILLCKTRAPWVGLVAALAFVYFYDPRTRPVLIVGTVFSLVAAAVYLPFLIESGLAGERIGELGPIANRLTLWLTSINMAIDNPILGIGSGATAFTEAKFDYATGIGELSAEWIIGVAAPHNDFFYVLTTTGMIGFVLYVTILYQAIRITQTLRTRPEASPFVAQAAIYATAAIVNLITNSMFVDLKYFQFYNLFVFAVVAVLVGLDGRLRSLRNHTR